MNCTKPDIVYLVGRLARYTGNLGHDHWNALVRVLRYLKCTLHYRLHSTRYPHVLEGCSDANWIFYSIETKSTNGYIFTLGGAVVSGARSTMESKFIALDKVGEEVECL